MESVVYLVSDFSYKVCWYRESTSIHKYALIHTVLCDGASYRVQSSFWVFPQLFTFLPLIFIVIDETLVTVITISVCFIVPV